MLAHLDWSSMLLTLRVAGISTAVSAILGVALAYLLSRREFPGRDWLDAAVALPLVLPPTVLGYYLLVALGRNGWLGGALQKVFGVTLVFTWQGAVVAAVVVSLPLVFKSARAAFDGVDRNLENAARTLGMNELTVFARVSLPLAWKGIAAGAMLAFARGMGEFGATLMIAGNLPGRTQTLSLAVYEAVQAGDDSRAGTLVILTSVLCVVILVLSGKVLKVNHG